MPLIFGPLILVEDETKKQLGTKGGPITQLSGANITAKKLCHYCAGVLIY